MGYLTTITISNDALDTIEKHRDEFMENLLRFCKSGGYSEAKYFSVGNHANPVVLQTPRHADNHTVYVHIGNTVVEMNPYSKETQEMVKRHPDFFDKVLKYMKMQVEDLTQLQKREGELCGTK